MGKVIPPIEIDNASLGPAMLALSPAMRAFVVAKVFRGFTNKECARWAGYSASSDNVLSVTGHNLAHDPRVQKAIAEETDKLMRCEGAASVRTLIEIRDDPTSEKKDRIKCAVELLNRSGFHAVTESISHVEMHMTEHQKDTRILALCAELGIGKEEARKMLVAPSEAVIDAAYEVVSSAEPPREEEEQEVARRERENELKRLRNGMTPDELAAHKAAMNEQKRERGKAEYRKHNQKQEAGDDPEVQSVAERLFDENSIDDLL